MRVMITGGTGFIGSRLVLRCLREDHQVTVLGQHNTPAEQTNLDALRKTGIDVHLGSVIDKDAVFEAIRGCDLVFHLAAAQHEMSVPDRHFYDVNVEGTRNVLEASLAAGVKRLVHGSTIGVYGSAMTGEMNEDAPVRPDNIYGRTKLEGERLALSFANRLPLSIVRISETYGPGDRRLLKLFKAIHSGVFFMIGTGQNKHQLIYVEDLIDGMLLATSEERAVGEVIVLAGSEVLTTQQMVNAIATALDTKMRRFRAPMWPFLAAAVVLEKTLRPLGIQPPLHPRRMDFFRKSFYFSSDKREKVLGFEPGTSFAQGAMLTTQWYRENGLL